MASAFYQKVVKELSEFIGEKADGVLTRQLKHCDKTADNFDKADLATIMKFLVGACNLYLGTDASKPQALIAKLGSLAK